jgi:hypothetical protein
MHYVRKEILTWLMLFLSLHNVLVKQEEFLLMLDIISLFWAIQSDSIFKMRKIDILNTAPAP